MSLATPPVELYSEFNAAFAKHWKARTGQDVTIKQSHGGAGKQARSIIDGLDADVATLVLAGDVFIFWENEAHLLEKEFGGKVDIVHPSLSVLAESAVTVVDKNVARKGTRAVAQAYLEYLYTDEGQDIAGKNFYRPSSEKAQAKYVKQLPRLNLFTIAQAFGGWAKADKDHFADGGSFDRICLRK
jgi:ABC-type sulfate transport system substrate-binding protein